MKKLNKVLCSTFLCAVTVLSGCNVGGTSSDLNTNENESNVKYTNTVLAENGKSDYTIVIPETSSKYEKFAANELQTLFAEATGAKLPIASDENVSYSNDAKYISISDTTLQEECGVVTTWEDYKTSGVRIVTKGNSLILTGYSDKGALYAVYDLLNILFNYNYYELDVYTLTQKQKVMLPDLDWKNIPDFDVRSFGDILFTPQYGGKEEDAWRLRYNEDEEEVAIGGHSNDVIVSPKKYLSEHPDWFYPKNCTEPSKVTQLCHTNEEMTAEYIKNLKEYLIASPKATIAWMGQVDVNVWCDCTNEEGTGCKDIMNKYNGKGAVTQILFANKVVKEINEWMATEYPGRRVEFYIYAYHATIDPPVHKDENGNYVPNDPCLKLDPSIVVRYADIYANRNYSFADNASVKANLDAWTALTKNLSIHDYPQDAANVCLPYDGLHTHADNLRYVYGLGHSNYKMQGVYGTRSSGFYNLRIYVCSKLMWDTTLDSMELAYDYIEKVYGEAAPYMKELFDEERSRMAYLRKAYNYGSMVLGNSKSAEYWPRSLLLRYEEIVDKAYEAIDYLKYVDAELYEIYFRNIKIEEMFIAYANCSLHLMNYSKDEKKQLIDDFEYYAGLYHFTRYSESASMSIVINQWRLQ